jgi:putative addiction module component (TIGR02574 family)
MNEIDAEGQPDLSEEVKAEIDRRLDDLDAHPEKVLTWEEVLQRLRLPHR